MDILTGSRSVDSKAPATLDLLGIRIAPMTIAEILAVVCAHVASREHCIITYMNLHGLYVYKRDANFRALNRRSLTHIDGMSVVWLARLFGLPVCRAHRVTWVDLIGPLLKTAEEREWRLYYLGGKPEVVHGGLAEVRRRYRSLVVDGHHGYLGDASGQEVRDDIRAFAPDLLIVGMGMRVQEWWILNNHEELDVPVICASGACIEYIAGAAKTPPRWLGTYGLEWIHRLVTDPRRFWRRYLVEPWIVLGFLFARGLGRRRRNDLDAHLQT